MEVHADDDPVQLVVDGEGTHAVAWVPGSNLAPVHVGVGGVVHFEWPAKPLRPTPV